MSKFIVKRNIPVENSGALISQDVLSQLEAKAAISSVEQKKPSHLTISYNINKVDFEDLNALLSSLSIKVPTGLFNRFRYGLWTMSDQNMKENLKIAPHCCNKAPR
ncbi:hypothetical protein [Terasakiella sp.]|uniref:hypothetical protein n=1 Tax=Terasakiella sp. TaxID=2034861 RepID=UPI003AA9D8CD